MKKTIIAFLAVVLIISCKKSNPNFIEGHYLADIWTTNQPYPSYPINNLTISMQILLKDRTHATVTIDGPENGMYSPGLNRKSITAPIKKVNSGVYLVDVTGIGSDTTESWITFYPNGNTFYVFTPPNYNKGNVEVKMKKVDW